MACRALIAMVFLTACSFDPSGIRAQADGDPTAPDAPISAFDAPVSPDAEPPDATPICTANTCGDCQCQGDCNGDTCTSGCQCVMTCDPSFNCKPVCDNATCTMDCSGLVAPNKCQPLCEKGATCEINCVGTNKCEPTCTNPTTTCDIDCTNATTCDTVKCDLGSQCTLNCAGRDVGCGFSTCKDSGGNAVVPITCCDINQNVAYRLCNLLDTDCPGSTTVANCMQ